MLHSANRTMAEAKEMGIGGISSGSITKRLSQPARSSTNPIQMNRMAPPG
jgi:hypothetical protein